MRSTLDNIATIPHLLTGNRTNDLIDLVREMTSGRLESVWIVSADLPEEISSVVSEQGCLCITIPSDWKGDFSQLSKGTFAVINRYLDNGEVCDAYVQIGGGQIELQCWTIECLECLETQFPVLFIRERDWRLVVYQWSIERDLKGLRSARGKAWPSFRTEAWDYAHSKERNRRWLAGETDDLPSQPEQYRHDNRLRGWAIQPDERC